jgi:hypothetical protein
MKKIIAITLFVLPFTALKAQSTSGVTYDAQGSKSGLARVESAHSDGSLTLIDVVTGERKYVTRDGEFHYGAIIVGTPIEYIEVVTPSGNKTVKLSNAEPKDAGDLQGL